MSEYRVLLIEHQAYLSIDLGRLCIRRPQQENVFILPADITVLCLHYPAITVTAHTLQPPEPGRRDRLGDGHCNQQNPFNLTDDLIEPYQPPRRMAGRAATRGTWRRPRLALVVCGTTFPNVRNWRSFL